MTRNNFFKYKILVMVMILLVACMTIPWPAVAASAPTVSGISPTSGTSDGGTSVTITGGGFNVATAVYFGSTPAASFAVNSGTQVTAVSPDVNSLDLPESTPVDITVYSPGGTSATSRSDQFTYIPAGFMGMNKAASPLTTVLQGTDTGSLIFTMGDSEYNPPNGASGPAPGGTETVTYNVYGIPAGATVTAARLYAYCAFSSNASFTQGEPISVSMTLNSTRLNELNSYSDTEGMGSYNFPCGNVSFNATSAVSGNGTYTAVLTNTSTLGTIGSFYGIGLLIIYHDPNGKPFEYWVNEGCDLIYAPYLGVTPTEATTTSSFTGGSAIDTSNVTAANLITVVPGGIDTNSSLTFNGTTRDGVYSGGSTNQLAVDNSSVTPELQSSGNSLAIQNSGAPTDYMFPTNAILAVYTAPAVSSGGGGGGGGGGSVLPLVASVSPNTGSIAGGTSVTISGNNLTGATAVAFGTVAATSFTVNSNGTIAAVLPAGTAGTVDVTVTTSYGTSAKVSDDQFTYVTAAAPTVSSVSPNTGSIAGGTSVTIGGSGFTGVTAVDFGTAAAASLSFNSDTQITATSPAGVGTVDVRVITPAGTSAVNQPADQFTYTVSTPTSPTAPTSPVFSDVPSIYWGYSAISSLSSQGIVSGYPNGTFLPDADISRAEFATMLVKALGLSTAGTTGMFTDVTANDWYYGYVNAAASAGLVSGMGGNMFYPNAWITREQMAVMMSRALGTKAPAVTGSELNAFTDASYVSSWAVSGMEEAIKAGIISGMTSDTLAPVANATRAQAAAMIYKLLTILGK